MREAGMPWPEMEIVEGLNEINVQDLFIDRLPLITENHPDLAALLEAFESAHDYDARFKTYNRLFTAVMERWVDGDLGVDGLESWHDFHARACGGLQHMVERAGRGAVLAAFTSGGPIAAHMQDVLGIPPRRALEFMWHGRNAAFTTVKFSGSRMSLAGYNETPHLTDAAYWTLR